MKFPTIDQVPPDAVDATRLVLKPETAWLCPPGSDYYGPTPDPLTLQFAAYLSDGNGEVAASSPSFASSDTNILTINASTGLATAVAPGIVTVTVTSGARKAFAQIVVQAGADCCLDVPVATAFVIDNSYSMSALFGVGYSDRLGAAKKIAHQFTRQFNDAKDVAGVISFNEVAIVLCELTGVLGDLLVEDSITQAISLVPAGFSTKTSLLAGVAKALFMLYQTTNRRVIILLSDGENRPMAGSLDAATLANEAASFKAQGGIIICVGLRATGAGYLALRDLASGGYFLNVLDSAGVMTAINKLAGLQCYYCAGVRPMVDGYSCLASPIAGQVPDPSPLAELEQSVQTL